MNIELKNEINSLLKTNKSLIKIYVEIFNKVKEKYGNNTIVLIEVGSFYEIYCPYTSGILYQNIKNISNILNIQLTRKNSKINEINEKNPFLLGFNSVSKSKFIKKILDDGNYNIVIISQKGNSKEKNVYRYVETVLSPGTDIDKKTNEENYIVSLDINISEEMYIIGYSLIDLGTGICKTGEFYSSKDDKLHALDLVIDNVLIYNISNIIINISDKEIDENFIIQYLELNNNFFIKKEKRKLNYQNTLLKKIYNLNDFILSSIEQLGLEKLPFATNSLIFLLEYIIDFEDKLLLNINKPKVIIDEQKLYIGNNGLEQLNVINNDGSNTLLSLLNCCQTSFGKRLFKYRLLNPITSKEELERRYSMIEKYQKNYQEIRNYLKEITDLEKIKRKIDINKLHPFELANLYFSLTIIEKYNDILLKDKEDLILLKEFINKIEKHFIIGECFKYNIDTISENLIQKQINYKLDEDIKKKKEIISTIEELKEKIDMLYHTENFITINYNERDGFYYIISKNRYKTLEKQKDKIFFNIKNKNIFLNEFKIDKRASNIKLTHPLIKELSNTYFIIQNKITAININYFKQNINNLFGKYTNLLEKITNYIAEIDISTANCKNSKFYNYTKPKILELPNKENKIVIKNLRHPIIEQVLDKTKYIPNDIYLGKIDNQEIIKKWKINNSTNYINGILLFGLNSSGKSSIQKALGLSIIMAQAGMYVPATQFEYTIYNSLFTRIISKDNPDRGLSTFAVEMLELKNILIRGNSKSLVLGDEICHGTETTSGVSIVAGAIKLLTEKKINFLFATHLHQLIELEEINKLNSVIKLHLEVTRKNDVLIYDRKLKPGSGSSIYGLEFAKSLNMNDKFLYYANNILEKLTNNKSEVKEIKDNYSKIKKYNSNIYSKRCAICNEPADDIHHIEEQKNADENNRINGIHKNHGSNIIPLCKKHHKMVHDNKIFINGFQLTTNGLKLDYNIIN